MDDIDSSNSIANKEDVATHGVSGWLSLSGEIFVYLGIAFALYLLCTISERRRASRRLRAVEESSRQAAAAANRPAPASFVLPQHRKIQIKNALVIRAVKELNKGDENENENEKAYKPNTISDIFTTKRVTSDSCSSSSNAEITVALGDSSFGSSSEDEDSQSQSSSLKKEEQGEEQHKTDHDESSSCGGERRYVFLVKREEESGNDDDDSIKCGPHKTENNPPQPSCPKEPTVPSGNGEPPCVCSEECRDIDDTEPADIEHQCDLAKSAPTSCDTCSVDSMDVFASGFLILDDNEEDEALIHKSHRRLDAFCSICLLGYEDEDLLAWSKNPSCAHAFHEECLVPWLVKHEDCPNCRCSYFDVEGGD